MQPGGFVLAATTNDLGREPEVRATDDALKFRMDKARGPIVQLRAYDAELPIVVANRPKWEGGASPDAGRIDRIIEASRIWLELLTRFRQRMNPSSGTTTTSQLSGLKRPCDSAPRQPVS